jgi:hypothetical protein
MNPEKVLAIHELKYPKNVKDVQRFLGMSGYYRKYIHNYAKNYRTTYKKMAHSTSMTHAKTLLIT